MEKDKNNKYWEYLEQNEAIKDTGQPDIGAGKEMSTVFPTAHGLPQPMRCHQLWGLMWSYG